MQVLAFPTKSKSSAQAGSDWRAEFFGSLDKLLDKMEEGCRMEKLWDMTRAITDHKPDLLGQLMLGFVNRSHAELMDQEYCDCPKCRRKLKSRGKRRREVETHHGRFALSRPYSYCVNCKEGFYPLDEALGLSVETKQYDVDDLGAWLASELPFETAEETYRRFTGQPLSAHRIHECTNDIAGNLGILDLCPTKEEIEEKVASLKADRHRRPVMMLAIDGAHAPTRPEPSPRNSKRGRGEYREIKGFRLYLIDSHETSHLISWHQIGTDEELAAALQTIKEAGLVPERSVRLCVAADGAPWIWNRTKEIFPTAKQVLDYYHCSEHLHELAAAQYGKETLKGREWVDSALTRLFHNQKTHVIAGIKRMKAASPEAEKKIESTVLYLTKHKDRLDYGAAKRGGYHMGAFPVFYD